MSESPVVTRIGSGVYRVETTGRTDVVYVAGPPSDRWVFCNGRVFRRPFAEARSGRRAHGDAEARQSLSAPMPATVLKVLTTAGAPAHRGETLVILEAMKMELPIRSAADATVVSVGCREGELVQQGDVLVELE